jgi:hypothetical protein
MDPSFPIPGFGELEKAGIDRFADDIKERGGQEIRFLSDLFARIECHIGRLDLQELPNAKGRPARRPIPQPPRLKRPPILTNCAQRPPAQESFVVPEIDRISPKKTTHYPPSETATPHRNEPDLCVESVIRGLPRSGKDFQNAKGRNLAPTKKTIHVMKHRLPFIDGGNFHLHLTTQATFENVNTPEIDC